MGCWHFLSMFWEPRAPCRRDDHLMASPGRFSNSTRLCMAAAEIAETPACCLVKSKINGPIDTAAKFILPIALQILVASKMSPSEEAGPHTDIHKDSDH